MCSKIRCWIRRVIDTNSLKHTVHLFEFSEAHQNESSFLTVFINIQLKWLGDTKKKGRKKEKGDNIESEWRGHSKNDIKCTSSFCPFPPTITFTLLFSWISFEIESGFVCLPRDSTISHRISLWTVNFESFIYKVI